MSGRPKHFKRRPGQGSGRGRPYQRKPWNGPRKPKEYRNTEQLLEVDVGITQFISDLDGFQGIIKARFSDFQVNEVDMDGEIVKLTNTIIPKDFHIQEEVEPNLCESIESPIEQIPKVIWESIKTMMKSEEPSPVEMNAENLTKEDRTLIHECIKKAFGPQIHATTLTKDSSKVMQFNKGKADENRRLPWPKDKGEYVHFVLYKENLDTLEATMKIADSLHMAASNFNYAGVKDKRGKTSQKCSVKKVEPWKLISKTRYVRNVRIGNLTFKDAPLKLGHLKGNKFRVALRNVIGDEELIDNSLKSLKEKGFINYFGLQRFGNDKEVPTYSIGVQLLLGNWKKACEIILKPKKADDPDLDITKAKKVYFETQDASKALEHFNESENRCVEYMLLSGLSKGHANEFVNAMESIPRNMRLLYLHSFQSLVWNLMVSKRIASFGLVPVPGDLIPLEEVETDIEDLDEEVPEPKGMKVKALTEDDCNNYTIYDIVLPLPGYDVVYPEHMQQFYKETLESYGLTLEMPKQKVKTYTLSGAYRKLMGKVQDLSWKIMRYNDPNDNLIQSDLEELQKRNEPKDVPDGKYKALILEFSLVPSSYATMVLREILKMDTASSSHVKLNNYHENNKETKNVINSNNGLSVTEEVPAREIREDSLLNDSAGFEQFKNLVFGEAAKRKLESDPDNPGENVAKVQKTDGQSS